MEGVNTAYRPESIPHRTEINPSKAHNIKSTPLQYG
jgi:hypothetical protein